MNRLYLVIIMCTLSFISTNVYSLTYGYTHESEVKLKPSLAPSLPYHPKIEGDVIRKRVNYYSCYSIYDGSWLNCTFKHSILGVKAPVDDAENNGGHDGSAHDSRENNYVYRTDTEARNKVVRHLLLDGKDYDDDPVVVKGTTLSADNIVKIAATVTHKLPKISGKIIEETLITAPRGWACSKYCFTYTTTRTVTTLDIGVQDLVKLPARNVNSGYRRIRTIPDDKHTFEEAYYGLPTTIEALKLISDNYSFLSKKLLSINDMSLRKGGVFDIKGKYLPSHYTHQEGKDVDINVDNIKCKDDRDFFIAVDMILPPAHYNQYNYFGGNKKATAINCEDLSYKDKDDKVVTLFGYRKHIDFEIDYKNLIGNGSFQ